MIQRYFQVGDGNMFVFFFSSCFSLQRSLYEQCNVNICKYNILCKSSINLSWAMISILPLIVSCCLYSFVTSTQCALRRNATTNCQKHWGSPTLTRAIEALVCLNQLFSDWQAWHIAFDPTKSNKKNIHEQCSKSLYHSIILVALFIGIPLLDYCNPQYIG